MSSFLLRKITAIVGIYITLSCSPVFAGGGGGTGGIVFDPTNFAVNEVTSAKAILAELHQYRLLANSVIDLGYQTRHLLKVPSSILGEGADLMFDSIRLAKDYQNTLERLYGLTNQRHQLVLEIGGRYGASGVSFNQYMAREQAAAREGDETSKAIITNIEKISAEMDVMTDRRRNLLGAMRPNAGMVEAVQTTSHQLDILAAQNSYVISMMQQREMQDQISLTNQREQRNRALHFHKLSRDAMKDAYDESRRQQDEMNSRLDAAKGTISQP